LEAEENSAKKSSEISQIENGRKNPGITFMSTVEEEKLNFVIILSKKNLPYTLQIYDTERGKKFNLTTLSFIKSYSDWPILLW
jgi:hypothetical protein